MENAHYIIFHPEKKRQQLQVKATVMFNKEIDKNWQGNIFVDRINGENEDPFVFNDPWLYSYCHASQLKTKSQTDNNLQLGSKLFFASGQHADKKELLIDTVFVIENIQPWGNSPKLQLPTKYRKYFQNNKSHLWMRHFRFPFNGCHASVSHTFEAQLWGEEKNDFSFLPLNKIGERVSIPFDNLPEQLSTKIAGKIFGKYPVLLLNKEMKIVFEQIEKATVTKVLQNITTNVSEVFSKKINS